MTGYRNVSSEKIEEILTNGCFRFAIDCLQKIKEIKPSENFVFSPCNIYEGLLLIIFASKGHPLKDLEDILHFFYISKIHVIKHYKNKAASQIRAGKFDFDPVTNYHQWYNERYCWISNIKSIQDDVHELFKNRLELLHFCKSHNESCTTYINKQLKTKMADYMCLPIYFNNNNENVDFILMTLLRFKGNLQKNTTFKEPQHFSQRPKIYKASTLNMLVTEFFHYDQSLFLFFSAVHSEQNGWEIKEDISILFNQLAEIDNFSLWLNNMEEVSLEETGIIYPKFFVLESELSLNQLLQMLNSKIKLFESDQSHLGDFVKEGNLHLGNGVHRAYIKTTLETDIVASAVTMFCTKIERQLIDKMDISDCESENSFLWLVYDKPGRIIISMGVVNKNASLPSSSKHAQ